MLFLVASALVAVFSQLISAGWAPAAPIGAFPGLVGVPHLRSVPVAAQARMYGGDLSEKPAKLPGSIWAAIEDVKDKRHGETWPLLHRYRHATNRAIDAWVDDLAVYPDIRAEALHDLACALKLAYGAIVDRFHAAHFEEEYRVSRTVHAFVLNAIVRRLIGRILEKIDVASIDLGEDFVDNQVPVRRLVASILEKIQLASIDMDEVLVRNQVPLVVLRRIHESSLLVRVFRAMGDALSQMGGGPERGLQGAVTLLLFGKRVLDQRQQYDEYMEAAIAHLESFEGPVTDQIIEVMLSHRPPSLTMDANTQCGGRHRLYWLVDTERPDVFVLRVVLVAVLHNYGLQSAP